MSSTILEEVQTLFKKKKLHPEILTDTGQVCAILNIDERNFPLFARIYHQNNLLQLIAFFPSQPIQKALPDIARALHRFNKELDIPGFGMDEHSKTVYFRAMIPLIGRKLDPELFNAYFTSVKAACTTFLKTIEEISAGTLTYTEIQKTWQKLSSF